MAILHGLREIQGEKEAGPGQGVIALIGFDFAVGLPSDLPSGYTPFQLFSKACELSGLRPGAWLGDRAVLYAAGADEFSER